MNHMHQFSMPGEGGWERWKHISQTECLSHQPNPSHRGFPSPCGNRQRLPPLPQPALSHDQKGMPGDTGWVQWMRIGCRPRKVETRKLPPLQNTGGSTQTHHDRLGTWGTERPEVRVITHRQHNASTRENARADAECAARKTTG
jgi:hypothetical protein